MDNIFWKSYINLFKKDHPSHLGSGARLMRRYNNTNINLALCYMNRDNNKYIGDDRDYIIIFICLNYCAKLYGLYSSIDHNKLHTIIVYILW